MAIEILDDKILEVAQRDVIWSGIAAVLGEQTTAVRGLNFVEFTGETQDEIAAKFNRLTEIMNGDPEIALDTTFVTDQAVVTQLWELRKQGRGPARKSW